MEAAKKTISDIFNGNRRLEIPFYQRAYVWDEPQWQRFLEDMDEVSRNRKAHFLGAVILKQIPTSTDGAIGDKRSIIDGQQRLTTMSIFFKALSVIDEESGETFRRQFMLKKDRGVAIEHSHADTDAFKAVMSATGKLTSYPGSQVTKCFNYFLNNIGDYEHIDEDAIVNHMLFVAVDLNADEDEQQIFDSINSLGVRLTTAELLKNYLFDRQQYEQYRAKWFTVFEQDDDDRTYWGYEITAGRVKRDNVELMLYAVLQILLNAEQHYRDLGRKVEVRLDNLFGSYKELVGGDLDTKTRLVQEIHAYAKTYRKHIDWTVTERKLTNAPGPERIAAVIFGLESTTLLPLTLFILANVEDVAERNAMFELLESYIMRRMVTRQSSMGYNRLFTEQFVGRRPMDRSALVKEIDSLADTTFAMPSDAELREGFLTSRLSNKQARGVLYMLETRMRGNQHNTDVLGMEQYTLEHVMPKKWPNHWGRIADEEGKRERDKAVATLGNLALLRSKLNTSVRDFSWAKKKTGGPGKDGLNRYAHGLETFDDWLKRPEWNEDVIAERGEWLYERAVEIWPRR